MVGRLNSYVIVGVHVFQEVLDALCRLEHRDVQRDAVPHVQNLSSRLGRDTVVEDPLS